MVNTADMKRLIIRVASEEGVPPDVMLAIAEKESGFNPKALGDGGKSYGMFQINTAAHPDYKGGFEPEANARYAARFLKKLIANNNNNIAKAIERYNGSGPMAVAYSKDVMNNKLPKYTKVANNVEKIALNVEDAVSSQGLANRYQGQITGAAANPYDYIGSKDERDKLMKAAEEQDKQYRDDIASLMKLNMPASREQLTDLEKEAYDYNVMNDAAATAQQLQQANAANLAQGYQQLAQQSTGMNDLLQQKYQAMRDLAMSDPRLQQGNYQVTPEQINNYQALNLQNQLAANIFGRPQLQLTSPQELARQQYEAQIANQYGVPYDTLVAAQADRIKNLGAVDSAEITFLQNRAAAGDTLAQEYLKQIGAGGGVKDIIKEGISSQGDIAKERIKVALDYRNKAVEQARQALQAGDQNRYQYYASVANNLNNELGSMTRGLISSADTRYNTDVNAMTETRSQDLNYDVNKEKNQIETAKLPSEQFKNTAIGIGYLGAADPTVSAGDWLNLFPSGVRSTVVNPQLSPEATNNILSSGTAGPRPNPTSANLLNKAYLNLRNMAYPNQQ